MTAPGVAKPALEGTPAGGRLPSTLEVEAIEEEEEEAGAAGEEGFTVVADEAIASWSR